MDNNQKINPPFGMFGPFKSPFKNPFRYKPKIIGKPFINKGGCASGKCGRPIDNKIEDKKE